MKTSGILHITNGELSLNEGKTTRFNRSIFVDSSNIDEVKKWNSTGVIEGVTSNQAIMLKDGIKPKNFTKVVREICEEMKDKPVSVELADSTASAEEMLADAKKYAGIAENVVVKVPLIPDSTKSLFVINELSKMDIAVNVTTIMTFEQMIMAALAARKNKKYSFLSLFWGRSIEDSANYRSRFDYMSKFPRVGLESEINRKPNNITSASADFLGRGGFENLRIIIGSIRTASMAGEAFAAGGHICTITPDILQAMLFSTRTTETIKQFDEAWKELNSGNGEAKISATNTDRTRLNTSS
jgi:transaldolase